jgi:drug/metabolite transporter (DMT)-like permease
MAFVAKLAAATQSGPQVAMLRFAVGLVPFLLFPGVARAAMRPQRVDLLVYRGVFGGTAVLLYFMAIEHIPVGIATLLNYTSPVWSGIFAHLFLGERLRRSALAPLALALAGVVLVVDAHATPGELLGFGRWELAAVVSSILSGAALAAIRAARRTEGSWAIFGSFTLCGLLATAPFALPGWRSPGALGWTLALAVGVLSIGAQLLMTHAYRWVDNVRAGVVAQLAVVVAMGLGVAVLDEPLGVRQLLGSLLALGGVVGVIRAEQRPAPAEA